MRRRYYKLKGQMAQISYQMVVRKGDFSKEGSDL